ncbi:CRM1 C terminal-domain-containing protein [Suillus lakei]|nr:CRM1 C terminal-domain-containing protein [Suillus lakei]
MSARYLQVQDMACDTFIKIAQKCRRYFVMQQSEEQEPFVDEILQLLHRITVDLSPQQVHTFYEAVGYIISAQPNKPQQEKLIAKLMELPNNAWDSLMAQVAQNMDVLSNLDNIKILSNVLKMNVDYNRNVPTARDAEVLNVMATITSRLGPLLTLQVPAILDAVFEPTLTMINQNFSEFPEHRKFLRAINLNCFPALLSISPLQFKLFMDSIIWAIKHMMHDIAVTGLNCEHLLFADMESTQKQFLLAYLELVFNCAGIETSISNVFFQCHDGPQE